MPSGRIINLINSYSCKIFNFRLFWLYILCDQISIDRVKFMPFVNVYTMYMLYLTKAFLGVNFALSSHTLFPAMSLTNMTNYTCNKWHYLKKVRCKKFPLMVYKGTRLFVNFHVSCDISQLLPPFFLIYTIAFSIFNNMFHLFSPIFPLMCSTF